jgi:quercetin dioxygenase-like cupin family protein
MEDEFMVTHRRPLGRVFGIAGIAVALSAMCGWAIAQDRPASGVPSTRDSVPATRDSTKHTGTPSVEMTGMTSAVRIEHVLSGHLTSLNGRYKLRASVTVFEPGGSIGPHHHAGPGLRYVLAGELTYVQPGRTTVYRTGDWFYESGDTVHTAVNRSAGSDTLLNVEILPVDWYGASAMPAPGAH